MALKQQCDQTPSKSPRKAGRAEKGPAVLPTRTTPGGASPPHGQPRRTDVRGRFSVTHLIVVRRQLVQKLLYARLFSRAVDVGDLVLGQAAVVLVHLRSKRGDCSGGPRPNPCPAKQPPPEPAPAGSSQGFRAGKRSRALLLVLLPFLRGERGVGAPARWRSSLPFARSASIALACFAGCGDVSAPASAGEVKKAAPRQPPCCRLSQPPPPSKPSGLFSAAICGNKQQIKICWKAFGFFFLFRLGAYN